LPRSAHCPTRTNAVEGLVVSLQQTDNARSKNQTREKKREEGFTMLTINHMVRQPDGTLLVILQQREYACAHPNREGHLWQKSSG
jgi:hypothetical protein